jgi:hypothetical protein
MFQIKGFCNTRMSRRTVIFSAIVFLLLLTSYAGAQTLQCTCDSCHGNPPVGDAHDHFSKIKQGLTCDSCHFGGMPTTPITDTKFQIGFSVNGKDGTGMSYDGLAHPVLGATYEATNNTTVTQNGTMKCSSVYCHGGGTGGTNNTGGISKSPLLNIGDPRPIAASLSPSWTDLTPIGCDYCHGYPPSYSQDNPKSNSHTYPHGSVKCNVCHYATTHDGVTIFDATKHHNGIYDVVPDPTYIIANSPLNFTYSYDAGGGKCSKITCHGGASATWGRQYLGAAINVALGTGCYEVKANAVSITGGTPPYTYEWDFGDENTESGTANTLPFSTPHPYAKGGTYTVTFNFRDARYHVGSVVTWVTPKASANIPPVASAAVKNVKGCTVTLTDLSYDPDYNQCGHTGAGKIIIYWADGTTTNQPINLTDQPLNQDFSHTYTTASTYYLTYYIYDNSGAYSTPGKTIVVTVPTTFTINGKVTHAGGGGYTAGEGFGGVSVQLYKKSGSYVSAGYTDTDGTYTITNIPESEHYDVKAIKSGSTFSPASVDVYQTTTDVNFVGTP